MIERSILLNLKKWKESDIRKPLLLRGARQVGKTTVVNSFGKSYKQYIYLNLERKENAGIFRNYSNFDSLVNNIFFVNNKNIQEFNTLIFIDEIQEVPEAINLLRYFYEDFPQFHVIAAGSLLETILNEKVNVPVGRVEYRVMRPVTFVEFLNALDENTALTQYHILPVNDFTHEKLLRSEEHTS